MSPTHSSRSQPVFPVVGVGASAGGLAACQRLFDAIPASTGMAFILVQHLDPGHASMMAELLRGHTGMVVAQAVEGVRIEPDHLYLIPPGMLMSLAGGMLHLAPAQTGQALRLPFDHLLRSMALDLGPRAVALVLTGTGADGSASLAAIRASGGTVLAQDPSEAAFDGMPRAALATGHVTQIAPIAGLAAALVALAKAAPALRANSAAPATLQDIVALLRAKTRHDFTHYKTGTLQRRIDQRISLLPLARRDLGAYLSLLQTDRAELERLAQDLLINVTSFFRDPEVFDLLATETIPALIRGHTGPQPIRIWIAGCSSGQEAYSIAMLIDAALETAAKPCDVQIFASDVDAGALAEAREGVYLDTSGVGAARLERYFTRDGAGFRVKPRLRAAITFAQHDMLEDPPFARLDLISCRNLMIYLAPAAQDRLLESFHFALVPGGKLLLGKAETAGAPNLRFQAVSDSARLFANLPRADRGALPVPVSHTRQEHMKAAPPDHRPGVTTPAKVSPKASAAELRAELAVALQELAEARAAQSAQREDALSLSAQYQAANEELLASKEELQALNEELTALNTQLQETLEEQRTTSEYLQNVLYSTNVATLFLNPDLHIRFFTPATRALFSLRPGDIGRPLADLAPLSSDQELLADAQSVLDGTPLIEREIEGQGGTWFNRRVLPYKTSGDTIDGVVITYSEITERHKTHEALANAERVAQHANDAKTRFLAVASHDLRQPLQTLVILQGLLMTAVTDARASGLVERLGETLSAMARMLDVLLDINQIEAGAIRPEKTDFTINEIFERLIKEFGYTARAKGLQLRMVPCGYVVNSDPDLLEQMLRNLVSNALKYTPRGKVLIGCRRRGRGVVIEVWDTGIGIAESEIMAVFEEYHQINNPARARSQGLGLGLSIVQRLGALLGHRINAVSTPGRGSVFTIEIDDTAPQQMVVVAPPPEPAPRSAHLTSDKARILIVEDDPEVLDLLDLLLRDRGHETLLAQDGPSALALVAESAAAPDLVLTDYNLPGGMNGLALAEELRRAVDRDVPAIVLTGDISTLAMRRISQQDVLHLAKPVTVERLGRAVADLLGPQAGFPAPQMQPAADKHAAAGDVVFLVDDDEALRLALRVLLREAGYTAYDYPTAEAFLASYVPGTRGCLLIDAYLPGLSGVDLLEKLKERAEPLASIMITGHSDVAIAVAAMRAGAVDFIEKPVSGADLLGRIESALTGRPDADGQSDGRQARQAALAALTPRQHEVLAAVLDGKASKIISFELGISQRTVETHRAAIMRKLGAKSVPALVRAVLGAG